ncbi:MAG TPA: histidine kinase [Chitinispirillaceae bacterium]|nr:histidine kinase [Chitinispirillaceae bacterium]
MKKLHIFQTPNFLMYATIFMVTQIIGIFLSLMICYVLADFVWGFVHTALINSFILGSALIGICIVSQRQLFRLPIAFIELIALAVLLGVGIISFFIVLFLEPALLIYYSRGTIAFLVIDFLFITALYTISSGLIFYREILLEKEKAIGRERYLKKQMEMKLLISKINPHFLFNTLNMILTLLKQPLKAEVALLNLSDLLRFNLEQSEKTTISVKNEIDSVRKYLEIQSLRFGEKLSFTITGSDEFGIPPLIIQPLVENCIKHNIKNVQRLIIDVSCFQSETHTIIRVIDSERKLTDSMLDKGHGLTITKKRIEDYHGSLLFKDGGAEIAFKL